MQTKNFIGIAISVLFLVSCGAKEAKESKQNIKTIMEFKKPVSAESVFSLMQDKKSANPEFITTLKYGDYHSRYLVKKDTPEEQLRKIIKSETERLKMLIKHFDPKKPMELPVYNEISSALRTISKEGDVKIINLAVKGDWSQPFYLLPAVKDIKVVSMSGRYKETEAINIRQQPITDWPDDAPYMPIAGTSTIWNTGTLQKFWFDTSALSHYNYSIEFGIEMDTVIKSDWVVDTPVKCFAGWSSNLPYAYKDTQASDTVMNCSVGTVRADMLQAWKLYYTWRDFSSFYLAPGLRFDVQFQSNSWCWWVDDFAECNASRPWCMCGRSGDKIQWVVSYYYNEAPGVELNWYRN